MKALLLTLAITVSSLVSAQVQVTTNSSASGKLFTPTIAGLVQVERTRDGQTGLLTAQLFYQLCTLPVEPSTVLNCQIGNGYIPLSALVGSIHDSNRADLVSVLVDTSQIEGSSGCGSPTRVPCFSNFLCFDMDEFGTCRGGQAPAVGGLVSMTWKKTLVTETTDLVDSREYSNTKLTSRHSTSLSQFTAVQVGTVLGNTANSTNANVSTGSEANGVKSHLMAERMMQFLPRGAPAQ